MFRNTSYRVISTAVKLQKSQQRTSLANVSNIVYRLANKKDKDALVNLVTRYIMQDEHYKGLQGSAEETEEQCDYIVRDVLRFPYTMLAYDNDQAIGFSLITNRHRDVTKNRLELLGPQPQRTPNFSALRDIRVHAENQFWYIAPEASNIFVAEAIYIEPEYRRSQIASTLVAEQFQRLSLLTKDNCPMDGMIAISTSYANMCQLEKLGFNNIYNVPSKFYRRSDGSSWTPADPMMPFAQLMYLKC